MIRLKQGVKLPHLSPQVLLAMHIVDGVYKRFAVDECWITSVDDGKHGDTTLHGTGRAVDFRIHNVPQASRPAVVEAIKVALAGDSSYEVYWEGVKTPNEHLHVEWDAK